MYQVKDGNRTLQFEGQILSKSSSWRPGASRWIEFILYKTTKGSFILSRVGVSLIFHSSVCPLVDRYGLHEVEGYEIDNNAVPCEDCDPDFSEPLLYPEKYRHWTLVSEDASAVVNALYRKDDNGLQYLTHVSQRLLDQAADKDAEIDAAYRFEYIP